MRIVSTKQRVERLLEAIKRDHPKVFIGLANRFAPPGAPAPQALQGIGDIFASTVNAVSNFVGSQGFDKLLTAASPFIANKVQQQQLGIQIKAAQAGVMVPQAATIQSGAYGSVVIPGAMPQPSMFGGNALPWILGGGALLLFVLMSGKRGRA